jgi:peptidoglycan/LPS O-acetylase OafA/YrhL
VRAIAVILVVLYHARVPWLPGGFLGVDIFFVLSGYLITSLLLAQYRRTGRIQLGRFWLGRARRLLPAALLVIVVCLIFESLFLRGNLGGFRSDALASAFYVNNWHQILAGQSYFAAFGRPSLVEHYWSLSVEEQFYLIWPLVLAAGLALSRRGWIVRGAIVAALVSVGLMALLYHGGVDTSRVYYGTDTRAAPLMIGVILAFGWPLGRMSGPVGPGARLVLDGVGLGALVGLVLIAHSWHDIDPFLYRGGFLIAALLAAVFIASASHPACSLGLALSTQPLRWIGQRSYGIYLWHWPVMALTRPGIDLTWSSWLLVPMQIAITLVLAAISFRYVEMPVRRGDASRAIKAWLERRRPSRRVAFGAATAAFACGLIIWTMLLPVVPVRSPLESLASATAAPTSVGQQLPTGGAAVGTGGAGTRSVALAQSPASITGGVLAVGSSVMLASKSALQHRLHATVDAAAGRSGAAIVSRLQAYRQAGELPPNVVVQVGDAGAVSNLTMSRLQAALSGVPNVVLVNIREPGESWEHEVNSALARAVRSWPAAIIADWRSASANPALLASGASPSLKGQAAYAAVVAGALTALAAKAPVQATIVSDSVAETIDETPQSLQALTRGLRLRLELKICRRVVLPSCTYQGVTPPPALQAIRSLGRTLGPVLVVDVGYNDDSTGYGAAIDQVMRAALAQGAREVIWLTLREFGNYASVYRETNAAIRQAARRWPEMRVADWNAYSTGKPWFADDVHPSPAGAVDLAQFIRSYITTGSAVG